MFCWKVFEYSLKYISILTTHNMVGKTGKIEGVHWLRLGNCVFQIKFVNNQENLSNNSS